MNRHLLLLPLLALLCGCSASDDGTTAATQGDPRIGFSVEANGGTRAEAEAKAFPTDRTFRVYAWNSTGGSWMMERGTGDDEDSNVVSYDNTRGSWYPKYTYYWPDDQTTVDFYAIYPANIPFNIDSKKIDFSTTAVSGSDDVLYCKSSTSKLGANHYATVYAAEIVFRHALSCIAFDKEELNGVTLYVNSITLKQIKNKGTFAFDPAKWTDDSDVSPSTTTYTVTPEEKDNLNESGNSLLLMPQTLAEGAQIVVEYKIQAANGTWLRGGAAGSETEWDTKTIALTGNWLIGNTYTYTLTANLGIFLSSTITNWGDGGATTLVNNGTTTLTAQ